MKIIKDLDRVKKDIKGYLEAYLKDQGLTMNRDKKYTCFMHADTDTSPNLSFYNNELVKCFSCGNTADIFKAYSHYELGQPSTPKGKEFIDIVRTLADRYNIHYEEEESLTEQASNPEKWKWIADYEYKNENNKILYKMVKWKIPPKNRNTYVFMGKTDDDMWRDSRHKGNYKLAKRWDKDGKEFPMYCIEKDKDTADTKHLKEFNQWVIYKFTDIIKAKKEGHTIYFTEGEKDAESIINSFGYVATTTCFGANSWYEQYNKQLAGANIVMIPDHDKAGYERILALYATMQAITLSFKVLLLPLTEYKQDISDWIAQGGTRDQFDSMVDALPQFGDKELKRVKEKITEFTKIEAERRKPTINEQLLNMDYNEIGNAKRLTLLHGDILKYRKHKGHENGKWMAYDGKIWEDNATDKVVVKYKNIYEIMKKTEAQLPDDTNAEYRKNLKKYIAKIGNKTSITNSIFLAQSEPKILCYDEIFDQNKYILNCNNGTIDLKTGELKPYNKDDFNTMISPINYDKDAKCNNWKVFINKIFQGDKELIEYIHMMLGMSLTGYTGEQCFFILYGEGSNGKSTMLDAILYAMGDYGTFINGSSLAERLYTDDGGARGELAKLHRKRFLYATECKNKQIDEELLKALTGEEHYEVRFMRQDPFMMQIFLKLWMGTNEKPKITGKDDGIWRRVRMIPMLHQFEGKDRQQDYFHNYLKPEAQGIFTWLVEGCKKWHRRKNNIILPASVFEASKEYRSESDLLQEHIDEGFTLGNSSEFMIETSTMLREHNEWLIKRGEARTNKTSIGLAMKKKGFKVVRTSGLRFYKGLKIIDKGGCSGFLPYEGKIPSFG